jgi:hypothetical protein
VYNKLAVFHAAGLLMGCNIGPLVNTMIYYQPDLVITALMATCTIFACFSAGALMAKRREFREQPMPMMHIWGSIAYGSVFFSLCPTFPVFFSRKAQTFLLF